MQLRGFKSRTKALGTLFHKIINDLMTINGLEPSPRVSSLFAQGTHQATKNNFVLLAEEYWNWNQPILP